MTSESHRARVRARWALGALVVVNAVVLWFYVGATASLGWHAKIVDETTLRDCSYAALEASGGGSVGEVGEPRFVGPATVRFPVEVTVYRPRHDTVKRLDVQCRLEVQEDASTSQDLLVDHAEVVR